MPARLRMQLARAASEALEQPTGDDIAEIYSADPLGLIAHADVFREYSVGPELWEVWTCDIPIGDVILTSNKIVASLNREITDTLDGCPMTVTIPASNTSVTYKQRIDLV